MTDQATDTTTTAGGAPFDGGVKPCPFCGGTEIQVVDGSTVRWRLAQCQGCGAQAGDVRIQTAGDGRHSDWEAKATRLALDEWNKRAPEA
jgi:Lar family restriction alleviation protein